MIDRSRQPKRAGKPSRQARSRREEEDKYQHIEKLPCTAVWGSTKHVLAAKVLASVPAVSRVAVKLVLIFLVGPIRLRKHI